MSSNRWLATGNYFTSYKEEQRIFFTSLDRTVMIVFILILFAWPLFFSVGNKYMLVIDNILVAIIAVMGLNLVTGFAGLISIGHAAFVGIGAYTVASFARVLGDGHVIITHAWPLMIVFSGCMGAVFGAIVGLPALRLKHLYLAIATLSFQMIFQWVINFMNFFNQGQTISVDRVMWITGVVSRKQHYLFWYYAILVVIVVLGFAVRNLLRTRYGRCLVAVRDNDRAADAMGMHPGFTKVYAFGLAGFLAGVAGALHAYLYRGVGIDSFTLHHSINYLAMAIVGGLGTLQGSFWGPVVINALELQVERLSEWVGGHLTISTNLTTALKPLSFGLYIFLPIASYSAQAIGLAEYVVKNNKGGTPKVAMFIHPSAFGRGPVEDVKKAIAAGLGIEIVEVVEHGKNLDNTAMLKRLSSKGVQYVISHTIQSPVATMLKDASSLGLMAKTFGEEGKMTFLGCHYTGGNDLVALAGPSAENFY